ncbi:hypothetical protein LTS18_004462 [Coniosporium uncinatum]|uniref:Uncharacterized protein n=1 Tax=Coniosporium uncinatum TaxID=93489 RepID=A0ACC3D5S3_9PEZI|nr:hypothetical protein LTS18_004462 [Coniosporium uncinatum]
MWRWLWSCDCYNEQKENMALVADRLGTDWLPQEIDDEDVRQELDMVADRNRKRRDTEQCRTAEANAETEWRDDEGFAEQWVKVDQKTKWATPAGGLFGEGLEAVRLTDQWAPGHTSNGVVTLKPTLTSMLARS